MFDLIEFKKIIDEYREVDKDPYTDLEYSELREKLLKIICKDEKTVKEFFDYMRGDMTGFEYGILSEISDEIAYEYPSFAFIEAYKMLAEKYPEETKKYYIADFIRDAEKSVKCSFEEGRTMY